MKKPIDVSVSEVEASFDELLNRASEGKYLLVEKDGSWPPL